MLRYYRKIYWHSRFPHKVCLLLHNAPQRNIYLHSKYFINSYGKTKETKPTERLSWIIMKKGDWITIQWKVLLCPEDVLGSETIRTNERFSNIHVHYYYLNGQFWWLQNMSTKKEVEIFLFSTRLLSIVDEEVFYASCPLPIHLIKFDHKDMWKSYAKRKMGSFFFP